MHGLSRTPSGGGLVTGAARRGKESARSRFPRVGYHARSTGARPRGKLLVALTPQGAKTSGMVVERDGMKVWVRKVNSAKHLLQKPEASWAFDAEKLAEAQATGVTRVEVRDEVGRTWWTTLHYLLDRGIPFDLGHGAQVRLPLRLWSFMPPDTAARQLALFGGTGG